MFDEAKAFSKEIAAVILAASRVVETEVKHYQAAVLMAEPKVRKRACEVHGGIGNAWVYFADPDVLDLARALHALDKESPK